MDNREKGKHLDKIINELEQEDINLTNYKFKDPEGVGDTIENALRKFGITEDMVEKIMGIGGCNCGKRRNFLNKIFPYRRYSQLRFKKTNIERGW